MNTVQKTPQQELEEWMRQQAKTPAHQKMRESFNRMVRVQEKTKGKAA